MGVSSSVPIARTQRTNVCSKMIVATCVFSVLVLFVNAFSAPALRTNVASNQNCKKVLLFQSNDGNNGNDANERSKLKSIKRGAMAAAAVLLTSSPYPAFADVQVPAPVEYNEAGLSEEQLLQREEALEELYDAQENNGEENQEINEEYEGELYDDQEVMEDEEEEVDEFEGSVMDLFGGLQQDGQSVPSTIRSRTKHVTNKGATFNVILTKAALPVIGVVGTYSIIRTRYMKWIEKGFVAKNVARMEQERMEFFNITKEEKNATKTDTGDDEGGDDDDLGDGEGSTDEDLPPPAATQKRRKKKKKKKKIVTDEIFDDDDDDGSDGSGKASDSEIDRMKKLFDK